jgi:hypothetical protein
MAHFTIFDARFNSKVFKTGGFTKLHSWATSVKNRKTSKIEKWSFYFGFLSLYLQLSWLWIDILGDIILSI